MKTCDPLPTLAFYGALKLGNCGDGCRMNGWIGWMDGLWFRTLSAALQLYQAEGRLCENGTMLTVVKNIVSSRILTPTAR